MANVAKRAFVAPAIVRLRRSAPDPEWLSKYILLDRWTAFTAACILYGVRPGPYDRASKTATAIVEVDNDNPDGALENFEDGTDHERELRDLAKIVAANMRFKKMDHVVPSEIVAWGLENRLIRTDSEVARAFARRRLALAVADPSTEPESIPLPPSEDLSDAVRAAGHGARTEHKAVLVDGEELRANLRTANDEITRLQAEAAELRKKAKNTGKQHAELREKILAAALHRLANFRQDCVDAKGKVVGAKLSGEVNDYRSHYGFPSDEVQPAFTTIVDTITKALSGKDGARAGDTKI